MSRATVTPVRDLPPGAVIVDDPDAMSMDTAYGKRKVSFANGWLVAQPVRLMRDHNDEPFWDAVPGVPPVSYRTRGERTVLAVTGKES